MRNGRGVYDNHTSMNRGIRFLCVKRPLAASDKKDFRKGMHMLVRFIVGIVFVAFVYSQLVVFNVIKFFRVDLKLSHTHIIA